ncbi:MAG: hypothetical protein PHH54_05205 [Candidatus Nanoarchaeia archaeon]|nr:hypothetical protein [Candidatus Nanoarchaeia archaeon]MDD5741356.1 hypothetical protein [Candidatus Nanoarchaeia archaeon]
MANEIIRKKYSADYHIEARMIIKGPKTWGSSGPSYSSEVVFEYIDKCLKYELKKSHLPTQIIADLMRAEEGIEDLLSTEVTEEERANWKTDRHVIRCLLELERKVREDFKGRR